MYDDSQGGGECELIEEGLNRSDVIQGVQGSLLTDFQGICSIYFCDIVDMNALEEVFRIVYWFT